MTRRLFTGYVVAAMFLCGSPNPVFALSLAHDVVLWPDGVVPVCWEPAIDPNGSLPIRIREAVENTWARYGNIRFEGWGTCEGDTPLEMPPRHIVYIRNVDYGAFWSGQTHDTGLAFRGFRGDRPFPTIIDLNFDASALCDTLPFGNSNDQCVAWTAVHEFGHALGFKHEHERDDFPGCKPWDIFWPNGNETWIKLTEYDESSTMNYCSDGAGTNKGRLSRLDIVGLQLVYGRKPWGSFVGPGGRCMDADNSNNLLPGSKVQLWDCLGGDNQRWLWSPVDGTLRLEADLSLCLDDPSGGKKNHTQLVVTECNSRVTPRWEIVNMVFAVMGEYQLGWRFAFSATSNTYSPLEYTDHGLLHIGNSKNCAFVTAQSGLQMQEVTCDPDAPGQQFFLSKSGQVFHLYRGDVGCLQVDDQPLPGVGNRTPIRIQECEHAAQESEMALVDVKDLSELSEKSISERIDEIETALATFARRLTQKFHITGLLRGANRQCIAIDDRHFISSNGLPLITIPCTSRDRVFFQYYFGRTNVIGLD